MALARVVTEHIALAATAWLVAGCPQLAEDDFIKADAGSEPACSPECGPGDVCCSKAGAPTCQSSKSGCDCGDDLDCDEAYPICCVVGGGPGTCKVDDSGCDQL